MDTEELDRMLKRVREASGCTRHCSLSSDYLIIQLAERFKHNGVSFSHAVDIDLDAMRRFEDGDMEMLLTFWCSEHHAGRPGNRMEFQRDGLTRIALIPEAVV